MLKHCSGLQAVQELLWISAIHHTYSRTWLPKQAPSVTSDAPSISPSSPVRTALAPCGASGGTWHPCLSQPLCLQPLGELLEMKCAVSLLPTVILIITKSSCFLNYHYYLYNYTASSMFSRHSLTLSRQKVRSHCCWSQQSSAVHFLETLFHIGYHSNFYLMGQNSGKG